MSDSQPSTDSPVEERLRLPDVTLPLAECAKPNGRYSKTTTS